MSKLPGLVMFARQGNACVCACGRGGWEGCVPLVASFRACHMWGASFRHVLLTCGTHSTQILMVASFRHALYNIIPSRLLQHNTFTTTHNNSHSIPACPSVCASGCAPLVASFRHHSGPSVPHVACTHSTHSMVVWSVVVRWMGSPTPGGRPRPLRAGITRLAAVRWATNRLWEL